ncbi:hypothetical protein COO59_08270 [Mixta theicola]|uniref:Glycosyltransferase n=2 Tax=Mixta theicola TaxID=1458355 RepID=A0A2K1QAA7_9GAMM|nr:hypothetical protein COO59_08270 [Mixta theicola]GLR10867.1 hypothetical protein GCM10007905_35870 [Mixta theicola]
MEQLKKEGHECDLLSDGDGWKGFTSTLSLPKRDKLTGVEKLLYPALDFIGLAGIRNYLNSQQFLDSIGDYDVIQLINPVAVKAFGALGNLLLIRKLIKKAPRLYLCALGGDFNVERFYLTKTLKYTPWSNFSFKRAFHYYQNISFFFPMYLILHYYTLRNVKKIIPGLYEYKQAYINNSKCTEIINLPINCEAYKYQETKINSPLKIFYSKKPHIGDYYKKGYQYFDEALQILKAKDVAFELVTANGIPFEEYKQLLSDCDILLDQTLSYDRGMSGVIGMANGMITFSGNESAVEAYYRKTIPCINAEPDSQKISSQLEDIIVNYPDYVHLREESKKFVKETHSVDIIVAKYLKVWSE